MVKQIWKKICTVEFYKACNGENKNTMTGLANCRKTNKHYAHLSLCAKSRKNNNAKLRKWPKSSISAIFWWFPGQISLSCKLFWKKVSLKLKVIFSINVKPKTKKIFRAVFEKNISAWFWSNLETFSQIPPNHELFSKILLCHFSTFIVP